MLSLHPRLAAIAAAFAAALSAGSMLYVTNSANGTDGEELVGPEAVVLSDEYPIPTPTQIGPDRSRAEGQFIHEERGLCGTTDVLPVSLFYDDFLDAVGNHYHGWQPPAGPPFYVCCDGFCTALVETE